MGVVRDRGEHACQVGQCTLGGELPAGQPVLASYSDRVQLAAADAAPNRGGIHTQQLRGLFTGEAGLDERDQVTCRGQEHSRGCVRWPGGGDASVFVEKFPHRPAQHPGVAGGGPGHQRLVHRRDQVLLGDWQPSGRHQLSHRRRHRRGHRPPPEEHFSSLCVTVYPRCEVITSGMRAHASSPFIDQAPRGGRGSVGVRTGNSHSDTLRRNWPRLRCFETRGAGAAPPAPTAVMSAWTAAGIG